jgi:hypothetical protein
MPLVRQFAFLTAGCPENEGVHNYGAVARSLFGSVCITCVAWPPCHKVGTLVHVGGDFARDASRARVGRSAFKKGWISRAVAMPHSSCIHRALLPSGPPDGVRQCSLEGSASGPLPPAISPLESSRSRGCCRSCLLLVVVRGAQPCGGRSSSTIARLQGFSSCSPAATPHWWSSRGMTTSLVVERSEPGCGLPPALSFKDVHHLCWGGGRAELGSRLPHGLEARFFLQRSGEKGVRQPCGGGELRVCGTGRLQVPPAAACLVPRLGWPRRRLRCCLLPFGWGVVVHPPHERRSRRAQVRHIHGFSCAGGCTKGMYKTSYAAGAASAFLDSLVLTPAVRTGARTSSRMLGGHHSPVRHWCAGGRCRRC